MPPLQTQQDPLRIPRLKISRLPRGKTIFWRDIKEQYEKKQFCDLELHFQGGKEFVLCHKIVLASVSGLIKQALLAAGDEPGERSVILVSDTDYKSIKSVVDFLYSFLSAGQIPGGYMVKKAALDALAIDLNVLGRKIERKPKVAATGGKAPKRKMPGDDCLNGDSCQHWEGDGDSKVVSKVFQPHVLLEKLSENCLKELDLLPTDPKKSHYEQVLREVKESRPVVRMSKEEIEKLRNPDLCKSILQRLIDCEGQLAIEVQKEPMRYLRPFVEWKPFKVEQFAIIGAKQSSGGIEGLTLTHKLREGEDPFMQYKRTGEACKSVLGFSTEDAFCQPITLHRLGDGKRNVKGKKKMKYVRDMARLSDEQLKEIVNDPEIVEITKRRTRQPIEMPIGHMKIRLNSSLKIEELDHLLMLLILETGEIKARVIKILDDDDGFDKTVGYMHKFIFLVWLDSNTEELTESQKESFVFKSKKRTWNPTTFMLLESPELKDLHYKLLDPCVRLDVAKAYLNGELKRETVLEKSVICPTCGLTFPLTNVHEEALYSTHQRQHFFEDFKCNCGIDFDNYDEKKWHVMLHHDTGRKYSKCDFCPFASTKAQVKRHMKKFHDDTEEKRKELFKCQHCKNKFFFNQIDFDNHCKTRHETVACSLCQKEVQGTMNLKKHMTIEHPGQVDENLIPYHPSMPGSICDLCGKEFMDKYKLAFHHKLHHEKMTCKICLEELSGTNSLRNHMAQEHPEHFDFSVCNYCGKKFMTKFILKKHLAQVHNHGDSRRFQCDMCHRSYMYMSSLKQHRITMHLKTLEYKCRVCGEGFYDTSQRHVHEKKMHAEHKHQHRKRVIKR